MSWHGMMLSEFLEKIHLLSKRRLRFLSFIYVTKIHFSTLLGQSSIRHTIFTNLFNNTFIVTFQVIKFHSFWWLELNICPHSSRNGTELAINFPHLCKSFILGKNIKFSWSRCNIDIRAKTIKIDIKLEQHTDNMTWF